MTPRERLIAALDFPTADEARRAADRLAGEVGMVKVGLQLFAAAGPAVVRDLIAAGHRVFLDLKFHDIPNTVAGAVGSASALGASLIDVHALGGRAMMEAGAGALPGMGVKLIAVTILTSHDARSLPEIGVTGHLQHEVLRLALLAREARLDGVVASPHEVAAIREACGPDFLIVTPGVRPEGAAPGDQKRAATPRAARRAGADYLVVGRPITAATDPAGAARRIADEIAD